MNDLTPIQIVIPSSIILLMAGWALREYIAHLRRRDADHTKKQDDQGRQMESIVQSLTRITDVLTGYSGHGGLLTRVDSLQSASDNMMRRVAELEKKVAVLSIAAER